MQILNNLLKRMFPDPTSEEKLLNAHLEKIKAVPRSKLTPYKFADLTKAEKETVRALAQEANFKGGWGENGKENWDYGTTAFKNGEIGYFGPIEMK